MIFLSGRRVFQYLAEFMLASAANNVPLALAQSLKPNEVFSSVSVGILATSRPVLGADNGFHLAYELPVTNTDTEAWRNESPPGPRASASRNRPAPLSTLRLHRIALVSSASASRSRSAGSRFKKSGNWSIGTDAVSCIRLWNQAESRRVKDYFSAHDAAPIPLPYHEPVLGMLVQGSEGGSAPPACSSSMEMPSGVRTKAIRPSRGGRLIVTPWAMNALQVS